MKNGKKSIKTKELIVNNGNRYHHNYLNQDSKKKVDLTGVHPKSFHRSGMVLDGTLYEKVIPCLEFSIEFQSNKLISHKEYTKRQQIVYVLIKHLHDKEGWGYRKISQWLNQSEIKTHRGKKWFNYGFIDEFINHQ